jgi:thioredoxin reductase (NADPH)
MHKVLIIGAGPIGLACGIEAAKSNIPYLIIEKGCLVNSIYNYPVNMTFFSTSDRLEIGDIPFISHGVKPTRNEALEYYRRVALEWNLSINSYEKVIEVIKERNHFIVNTDKSVYKAEKIIIATGFYDYPNLLNIPGENLDKVKHYFDDAHPYSFKNVIVVGGGNSAVDTALETFRKGANVTMVIKKNNLDDGVKYWVRPDIENRIKEGSIKAYFNSEIKEVKLKSVSIKTQKGELEVENDFVLAMTGYHPDFDFLQSIGIELSSESKSPFCDPNTFETNIKGIYVAGVVCGGMETGKWFIENSRVHAEEIMKNIMSSLK